MSDDKLIKRDPDAGTGSKIKWGGLGLATGFAIGTIGLIPTAIVGGVVLLIGWKLKKNSK